MPPDRSSAQRTDAAFPSLSGTRVVIADDDRFIRAILENRLSAMGCETHQAANGADAWALILESNPSIAFVDLSMPDVDGYELMERIRAHPRTKHLPVVVITSSSHKAAIDRAFSAGATSFLLKPIRWSTFDSHVHYLLRLTRAAEESEAVVRSTDAALSVAGAVYRKALATSTMHLADIQSLINSAREDLSSSNAAAVESALAEVEVMSGKIDAALRSADRANQSICSSSALRRSRTALSELLAAAVEGCQTETLAVPIELNIKEPLFSVEVLCDPGALAVALSNLLDNAVLHAQAPVSVELQANLHEDFMLSITVIDDGPGMCPEFASACLAPLSGKTETATATVGLPLARALIEAHGGRLELRTSPGHGTAAMLTIPPDRIWLDRTAVA